MALALCLSLGTPPVEANLAPSSPVPLAHAFSNHSTRFEEEALTAMANMVIRYIGLRPDQHANVLVQLRPNGALISSTVLGLLAKITLAVTLAVGMQAQITPPEPSQKKDQYKIRILPGDDGIDLFGSRKPQWSPLVVAQKVQEARLLAAAVLDAAQHYFLHPTRPSADAYAAAYAKALTAAQALVQAGRPRLPAIFPSPISGSVAIMEKPDLDFRDDVPSNFRHSGLAEVFDRLAQAEQIVSQMPRAGLPGQTSALAKAPSKTPGNSAWRIPLNIWDPLLHPKRNATEWHEAAASTGKLVFAAVRPPGGTRDPFTEVGRHAGRLGRLLRFVAMRPPGTKLNDLRLDYDIYAAARDRLHDLQHAFADAEYRRIHWREEGLKIGLFKTPLWLTFESLRAQTNAAATSGNWDLFVRLEGQQRTLIKQAITTLPKDMQVAIASILLADADYHRHYVLLRDESDALQDTIDKWKVRQLDEKLLRNPFLPFHSSLRSAA